MNSDDSVLAEHGWDVLDWLILRYNDDIKSHTAVIEYVIENGPAQELIISLVEQLWVYDPYSSAIVPLDVLINWTSRVVTKLLDCPRGYCPIQCLCAASAATTTEILPLDESLTASLISLVSLCIAIHPRGTGSDIHIYNIIGMCIISGSRRSKELVLLDSYSTEQLYSMLQEYSNSANSACVGVAFLCVCREISLGTSAGAHDMTGSLIVALNVLWKEPATRGTSIECILLKLSEETSRLPPGNEGCNLILNIAFTLEAIPDACKRKPLMDILLRLVFNDGIDCLKILLLHGETPNVNSALLRQFQSDVLQGGAQVHYKTSLKEVVTASVSSIIGGFQPVSIPQLSAGVILARVLVMADRLQISSNCEFYHSVVAINRRCKQLLTSCDRSDPLYLQLKLLVHQVDMMASALDLEL